MSDPFDDSGQILSFNFFVFRSSKSIGALFPQIAYTPNNIFQTSYKSLFYLQIPYNY